MWPAGCVILGRDPCQASRTPVPSVQATGHVSTSSRAKLTPTQLSATGYWTLVTVNPLVGTVQAEAVYPSVCRLL